MAYGAMGRGFVTGFQQKMIRMKDKSRQRAKGKKKTNRLPPSIPHPMNLPLFRYRIQNYYS
jgi:hypothetical protein